MLHFNLILKQHHDALKVAERDRHSEMGLSFNAPYLSYATSFTCHFPATGLRLTFLKGRRAAPPFKSFSVSGLLLLPASLVLDMRNLPSLLSDLLWRLTNGSFMNS